MKIKNMDINSLPGRPEMRRSVFTTFRPAVFAAAPVVFFVAAFGLVALFVPVTVYRRSTNLVTGDGTAKQ
jgi:hypothetical protein